MLTVDEALGVILNRITVLGAEDKPLLEALGRVAARDYRAESDVPDWISSAKDGFAVRAEDVRLASLRNPAYLKVIETVMAGSSAKRRITPGAAIRIMTGAPLPPGADCVVGFEETSEAKKPESRSKTGLPEIGILRPERKGNNVYPAGHQIAKGELLAAAGTLIGPAQASLLASLGLVRTRVFRRPVVAIVATGSELVSPGRPLSGPRIYSGSSFSLAQQVRRCGGIPQLLGIARDTKSALSAKLMRALKADIVITTGGVALGDRDLVKAVLTELGDLVFSQVRMMPGKSTAFGLLHNPQSDGKVRLVPHFALSGNPPATITGFEVLVRPAILKIAGRINVKPCITQARLDGKIANRESLRRFVWVTLANEGGVFYAKPAVKKTGGTLTAISEADGLAVIPEKSNEAKTDDLIQVLALDWI